MLLLDIGNSRCKWAWVEAGVWKYQGAVDNTAWNTLRQAFDALPVPDRILASNVAGESVRRGVESACADWGRTIEFLVAGAECAGVRNHYQHPERLGSDRWAALIAARHLAEGACLVVNCGTATTIDALSAQGDFLGGLILPGISLMQQSLVRHTAQLKPGQGQLRDFPLETSDAIYSGALHATAGAVQRQFHLLRAREGAVRCLVDGGAADALQRCLALPCERVDNLVLKGLRIIAETET